MSAPASGRGRPGFDIWPGFVDALATLLMVIIFVLLVFVLSQFYLSAALSGRDETLVRLNRQLAELSQMLSIEKETSAELRLNLAQVAAELQTSTSQRDQLQLRVTDLGRERDSLTSRLAQSDVQRDQLQARLADLARERDALQSRLTESERGRTLSQAELNAKTAEALQLLRDIDALKKVKDDLEVRVGQLAARLDASARELGAVRDRSKELEARLATAEEAKRAEEARRVGAEERTLLVQREREATATKLTEQEKLTRDAQDQVELLNRQLLALRQQLARISAALDISEEKSKEQQVQIADLGRRLNLALASKVEELARYRSEFFGRLREALGDRPDIRVVGDRFVFQSEVLFGSGSSTLGIEGQEQLWQLARTLRDVIQTIPADINWVLQVDGHTDTVRIATAQFPSNWELSTARATSVVKFLISQGLPSHRLAAAGYGEFQPIEEGTEETTRRRNRRIELKLTSR
ncbi:MAG: peptidoglycan -binding protein [Alphaproteobacteria bacterium]|nr:peptidoglycan -binding protein [Alphaproteobacteria bacterium]